MSKGYNFEISTSMNNKQLGIISVPIEIHPSTPLKEMDKTKTINKSPQLIPAAYTDWVVAPKKMSLVFAPPAEMSEHPLFPCTFLCGNSDDVLFAEFLIKDLNECSVYIDPDIVMYNNESFPDNFALPALYIADGLVTVAFDNYRNKNLNFTSTTEVSEFFKHLIDIWKGYFFSNVIKYHPSLMDEYNQKFTRFQYLHKIEGDNTPPKLR